LHLTGVCRAQEFYNRDEEKKYLTTLWSNKPTSVLIVLGPPSSGKSGAPYHVFSSELFYLDMRLAALLKELVFSRKKVPLPLYTDCRANNYLNSDAFAKNLLKGINRSWHDRIEGLAALLKWTITTSSPAGSLRLELPPGATSSTSLELIFEVFDKVVSDAKMSRQPGDPWPLIIIDDANRLMNWRTSESESLEQLLAYFVRLSKQEKLAHVVLATSDSSFLPWLTKRVWTRFAVLIGSGYPAHAACCVSRRRYRRRISQ
jgi:AAA+ ATPase superfamily predicted ATPase